MILSMIGLSTGGSAPVLHAVLLRKFAFNLGFQKNHGTLQKQMRVSENGQEAKGDMAWEEEWTCDSFGRASPGKGKTHPPYRAEKAAQGAAVPGAAR